MISGAGVCETMRRIMHVDMDAFFASIEQRRRPELRGKPIIVGGRGDPRSRGVVSTASYEARKYGVGSGMPLRTAYALCPECIFLPVDYGYYAGISEAIKAILHDFTPIIEDGGIDEAYLDVSGLDEPPEAIAEAIKRRIKEATGLSCSVGIAPNKLLAKMASDLRKPDGLTRITEKDVERLIWPLRTRKLVGIGPKTESRLAERRILTIGELAAVDERTLVEWFGNAYGRYLYEASRGIDESPLVTHWEPKSHGREVTFEEDTDDPSFVQSTLSALAQRVADEIKARGYRGKTVTVKLRFSDFETHTRSQTLEAPSDSPETIKAAAFDCLGRFDISKKVRLIGVRVEGLSHEE
jgi:DNA polymerase-4